MGKLAIMLLANIFLLCIGSALAVPQYNSLPPPTEPSRNDFSIEDRSIEDDASLEDEVEEPLIDENGMYIVDDLRLTEDQFKANFGTEEESRQALSSQDYRWTNGYVPFKFDSSVSKSVRNKIRHALKQLNAALTNCVRIRERSGSVPGNYLRVRSDNAGCYSYVGMLRRGAQDVNLGNGCHRDSTIMHEFIHSLGMYHVQSRADRDKYVEIKWDNIKKGKEHNFNKHKSTLTFGVPYDPLSIMHYEYWSFAKDSSKPTIVSKVSGVPTNKLGSAEQLRDSDIRMIRKAYGCDMNYTTPPPPPCQNKIADATCEKYAGWGICNDSGNNGKYMEQNCQLTCNKCP